MHQENTTQFPSPTLTLPMYQRSNDTCNTLDPNTHQHEKQPKNKSAHSNNAKTQQTKQIEWHHHLAWHDFFTSF